MRARHLPLLLLAACAKAPDPGPARVKQAVFGSHVQVSWETPPGATGVRGFRVWLVDRFDGSTQGGVAVLEASDRTVLLTPTPGEPVQARVEVRLAVGEGQPVAAEGWAVTGPLEFTTRQAVTGQTGIAAGDLDGDGRPDLVLVEGPGSAPLGLLGRGDGTFGPPRRSLAGGAGTASVKRLMVADADGDGRLDLLAGGRLFRGRGDGTFLLGPVADPAAPTSHWAPSGPGWALADLNGDGRGDVVQVASGRALGFLALPDGGLAGPVASAPPDAGALGADAELALADFDRDGRLDLAFHAGASLITGLGDGQGGFALGGSLVRDTGVGLVARDFTGDGCPDLALPQLLLIGGCDGGFTPVPSPIGEPQAVGDFDGDGLPDLLDGSRLLLGDGAGHFRPLPGWPGLSIQQNSPVAVADFDGDGRDDLAYLGAPGGLNVVLMR